MVDWTSKSVEDHMTQAGRLMLGVSMGFFFYDWILAFPFDVSILRGKRQRRWPQVAYFATKIFMLGYLAITLILNFTQTQINCQTAMNMLEMLMGFTVVASSVLLACRTICVYEGPTKVLVTSTLLILALGLLAAWMQGVTSVTSVWMTSPDLPGWVPGVCPNQAIRSDYWVKYVCTIIFDAVVLFLTAFGIIQLNGSSRIGVVLVRQGIIYFLLTFFANLAITIFTLLQKSPLFSLLLAVPQTTTCVICACRLYINLAKEARSPSYDERHPHSGAVSSMTPATVQKNIEGATGEGTHSNSHSSGSAGKKSAIARFTRFVRGGSDSGDGRPPNSVPSYFSSSSDPHAPRRRRATAATAGAAGAGAAAVGYHIHGNRAADSDEGHMASPELRAAATPYGQAQITQTYDHGRASSADGYARHVHPLDLEKQQPPRPTLSTDPSYDSQYYEARSNVDVHQGAANAPPTHQAHEQDDDDVARPMTYARHPQHLANYQTPVPPRRSSNGGAGAHVETARFLHASPDHVHQAPVPAYTPSINSRQHSYQQTRPAQHNAPMAQQGQVLAPWDFRQDDEVSRTLYPRLVQRHDAPPQQ